MQSTNNPDPRKSLFDFINYHKSTANEEEDFKLVSALTQSDTDNSDSPKSLFDFINSHKSVVNDDEDIQSLSDLASKYLSIKRENREVPTHFSFPVESQNFQFLSSIVPDSDSEKAKQGRSNKFTSLEEYRQSYLTSKNKSAVHCQITDPSCNSKFTANSCDSDIANKNINESLSNIKICDVKKQNRTIDLTTALLNVTKNNSESAVVHTEDKVHRKALSYPTQECIIDISFLATENVLYNDAKLSHFGYVISKKWIPLSRKYKCIGKSHPYNIASSFKFNVPSPDELFHRQHKNL